MDMKNSVITGIDMQKYYDDLVLQHKALGKLIETLGADPSICTHSKAEIVERITVCANIHCRKIIDTNGLYDCLL